MIDMLIRWTERSPAFRRFLWHRWYQYLAGYNLHSWSFMNYGFEPAAGEPRIELAPDDEADRYCIQLYHRVATAVPLTGKTVIEVGSGRGGGCSYVQRYFKPTRTIGVDFSGKAVRFSRRKHPVEDLRFLRGDAESLPLDDGCCDAVLNVESSHCYGSVPRFFSEVYRVLRPEGYFLFADFRTPEGLQSLRKIIQDSGFECVAEECLSEGVLRALTLDSSRKRALLEASIPRRLQGTFGRFAAIEGSDVYKAFADNTFVYHRFVLQRPNASV